MKLKVLELFGGIGACSKALERLGIDYEIADYVEIDKYAVKSFNAMYNTNFEPQDICEWDKDIEVDLIMHGSPCQDFSLAGKQAGGDEGSGTRSSLMYETIRIVEKLRPKYVIWENVKNLLSKKHRHNFDAYLEKMNELGYVNYYQVLNAKDYGIPQNRERVFTISILKENPMIIGSLQAHASKRIDGICSTLTSAMGMGGGQTPVIIENIQRFEFPQKQELKLKLKDILENEVDEKYYLSEKMIKYISATGTSNFKNPDCKINLDIARPLTTDPNKRAGTKNYLSDGLPDNYDLSMPMAEENENTNKPKVLGGIGEKDSNSGTQWKQQNRIYDNNVGISVCTCFNPNYIDRNLRIRKLTPKECWRLMGFDDEDYERASKVNSNTQLYKQAGNSIVVNVLEAILTNLLK